MTKSDLSHLCLETPLCRATRQHHAGIHKVSSSPSKRLGVTQQSSTVETEERAAVGEPFVYRAKRLCEIGADE